MSREGNLMDGKRAPAGPDRRANDSAGPLPTLGELDLHLIGEGRHWNVYDKLGAHLTTHGGEEGTAFAVWAPNARAVYVVGDFNDWEEKHPLRSLGDSGVWELFVPGVKEGALYKFAVAGQDGGRSLKTDPYAQATEIAPDTACIVTRPHHRWRDEAWMERRETTSIHQSPLSIYEVHLGSWRRTLDGETLGFAGAAEPLADYCVEMGFTHVELMPPAQHPYSGSWGYQVTNYYAPDARLGGPDELAALVDRLHRRGIGVIIDWVPAHFPDDEWALGRYDGTHLYEHADPREGRHPDWGTLIFNYGRKEVRNFLIANALFWIDRYHVDGIRIDGVASMLYRDYSREADEWIPNEHGGRENLEAISLLQELNVVLHERWPGAITVAEESTAFPGVTRVVDHGGLGFDFKWNMGWMHDTLEYFARDPIHRAHHHDELTFSLVYAWDENFILPLSHDEVVHGKSSLINKMPGDETARAAQLRTLFGYMWAHPGKQLLFMGCEFGQTAEWNGEKSLDWHLLESPVHSGLQALVAQLNRVYADKPALWELDHSPEGFEWIDSQNADHNIVVFARRAREHSEAILIVSNFAPVEHQAMRFGVPGSPTRADVLLNTAQPEAGSDARPPVVEEVASHGRDRSVVVSVPPLATLWLGLPDAFEPE
jgi:1,4-alpha-glucan branching enzyme